MAQPPTKEDKRSLYDKFRSKGLNIGSYEEFDASITSNEEDVIGNFAPSKIGKVKST